MACLPFPKAKQTVAFFALVFLLLVSCHSAPIQTSAYHAPGISHASITPDKLSSNNDADVQKDYKSAPGTPRMSMFNVIQPAINAAVSSETHKEPTSHLPEKLSKVDYLSSPLQGTEERDRQALGMRDPQESTGSIPMHDSTSSQQRQQEHSAGDIDNPGQVERPHIPSTGAYSHSSSHQYNHGKKGTDNSDSGISDAVASGLGDRQQKADIPLPRRSERSQSPGHSAKFKAPASSKITSSIQVKSHEDADKKKPDLRIRTKEIISKAVQYTRRMYNQLKSTLNALKPRQKATASSVSEKKTEDGYTEQDVLNLVNDIMREIQARTDDMRDHAEMLQKTERWDPNDITTRERQAGIRDGPLLYMRTKVLVTPETVVDAVMTSTKKLFSSRTHPLPWSETSKLLKEVQSRLSEVLSPAN